MRIVLDGVRPWRHDLAGCLHSRVGQDLGDRDAVEVGKLGEPGDGDVAVTPLVGPHDGGLPPALGRGLHVLEGHPLLDPNVPKPLP